MSRDNGNGGTNELALQDATLPALTVDQDTAAMMAEAMAENIGGEASVFDLPRLSIPGGGGTQWEVPTDEGEVAEDALRCVIVAKQMVRAYYDKGFEETGGGPPACFSPDCKVGIGDPGGNCSMCPYAQFGSAKNGAGQACSQRCNMLVLTEHSALPYLLSIPPTSLKPLKNYLLALSGRARPFYGVMSEAKLEKRKNAAGIAYGEVNWRFGRQLSDDELAMVSGYKNALGGLLGSIAATVESKEDAETIVLGAEE